MNVFEKLGGIAVILGSLLLSAYAVLFPILLPLGTGSFDYAEVVRSPAWVPLALVAFAGVLDEAANAEKNPQRLVVYKM